jgi:hypothetical protein
VVGDIRLFNAIPGTIEGLFSAGPARCGSSDKAAAYQNNETARCAIEAMTQQAPGKKRPASYQQ